VDDEAAVADVIADVLQSGGHETVILKDGAAAIERVRTERFDAVFTDLAMPGVTGWQVARAVKTATPDVPVFIVTGFGVELSAEERRTHGVDGVLVKPLKIHDLLDAAAHAARRRADAGETEDD
jgi:CheY-like chemotaxis protein